MNPRSVSGWGLGPGCMLGTKHLFGEQSGSSAVCLRQLFPQRPTTNQLLRLADGTARRYFLHPRERRQRRRQLERDGVWKEGADPRTGGEETQERFSSIYSVPFPPAANEPPSQAWRERRLRVRMEKAGM
ncbi:hypothetical protein QQF64_003000 [Cirrhinus molitorella]|uniref:Uncharacterized protein n=1 Tax=Cirrhinus molitorella TaxID=172907 RepID=A0ABR3MIU2_9TELE